MIDVTGTFSQLLLGRTSKTVVDGIPSPPGVRNTARSRVTWHGVSTILLAREGPYGDRLGVFASVPSPRYRELIGQYSQMHVEGETRLQLPPEQTFGGGSLLRHVPRIRELVRQFGAGSLLDYGSGKGMQYRQGIKVSDGTKYASVLDFWGVESVTCFDPGFAPFNQLPAGKFDGVICTDVLEHCPEEDIRWIVGEVFSFARSFVFCNVACYPAQKHLPNGENAHCTVKSKEWWRGLVGEISAQYPGLFYEITLSTPTTLADGRQAVEKECLRRVGT